MTERVTEIFEKIFPETKLVNAKVVPKLDNLYKMAIKLRKLRKMHRYYRHKN